MPSNIQNKPSHDPAFNGDSWIGVPGQWTASTPIPTSFNMPEISHCSAHDSSMTGERISMPLPEVRPKPHQARTTHPSVFGLLHQAAGSEKVPTGDSRAYAPSPPFEEAGPTSSVWHAYLDESQQRDNNMVAEERGELNILLVSAGLFSAIITAFLILSTSQLDPDYQKMAALLLFDQINIQRALANGTSLGDIITSNTDPTAPFTPDSLDVTTYRWLLTSLILSLLTALLAIFVDGWYVHYLSPITGQPKVRARTRHVRHKGVMNLRIPQCIILLKLMLIASLQSFWFGFVSYTLDISVALMCLTIAFLCCVFCLGCRYISMDKSSKESEVDALHWLYERSSTLAIRRLIIQALAGLPPDDISRAEEVFHPHWDEMQEEKERMLMDCVQLSRDGFTRWIPKDIPNIGSRIEPLLRLEILFPSLRRKYPSRVFGEHDLDFSRKLSNTLSMTLSAIDDAHIQKPVGQNQLIMDVFADNSVHHPLIWERLLGRYVDKENLINTIGEDGFTIGMCLNLVTSIYPSEDSSPGTDNFTLAYPLITSHKNEILRRLLTFFPTSESDNITVDLEHSLSLAIFRSLVPDLALSIINSHQPHRFCRDSIFSKYQLLHVALRAIKQAMFSVVDHPSKEWRTHLFWAILSYIKSDLFSGHALTNSEYWEFKDPFWACRAYALVCMGLLIGGSAEDRVIEWNKEWANKDLFTNILLVINDEHAADAPFLHPVREITGDSRHPVDSISGVVGWLFGQAFKQGIPGAYEAFQESGSLGYIAEKRNLHPELIEGLCGYITGLSSGKAGRLPDIQLNELINRHIDDLHQVPVIRCICASLARSETPEHPILSTLASIAPYHNEWSNILQILNSPDHKYSVQCYTLRFADMRTREDAYYLQRDMKRGVSVLADCLESQKCRNRNNDQLSANSDHLARGQETHHRSGSTTDPDTDVELGLLSSQNVDVT